MLEIEIEIQLNGSAWQSNLICEIMRNADANAPLLLILAG